MRSHSRGSALGSTFLIILFLVIFALTLTNLATFDLRTVTRQAEQQLAFSAAETGLETVIAEMAQNPEVGQSGEDLSQTLPDGSSYNITFDSSASSLYSVNNFGEVSSGTPGALGRSIPPLHAHLIAEGVSPQGEVAQIECLIRLEAVPYAVAGTGQVRLSNTFVAGSETLAEASTPTLTGSVYSGRSGPSSTRLQGATQVTGDARAVGGITVAPLAGVAGDIDDNHAPESLPNLNVTDFDNGTTPGVTVHAGGLQPTLILSGQHYFDGPTTFAATTLADATVYVNGDLTVAGTMVGRGTLFVDGETTFVQTINLTGSSRLTLFSADNINILLPSVIQGVLYTHGNVNTGPLLPLTVFGAVYAVATPSTPGGGNVSLGTGSTVVHVTESTAFASTFLARNGGANPIRVFWSQFP